MGRTHDIAISGFDLDRIEAELEDTKATADFWIRQAKRAEEAAADLQAELADTRREWKAELAAERALADRLADALRVLCETLLADKPRDITEFLNKAGDALSAWKEARSE